MAVQDRFLRIECNVPEQDLRLRSFSGSEEISRLFRFNLDLVCPSGVLKSSDITSKLIGKPVSLTIDLTEGDRKFNGHISHVAVDYSEDQGTVYQATMVPWVWFLTQTSDCRIFHDQTIPQIIETILGEAPISGSFQMNTEEDHPQIEYCVQYRETDFNFISRLMEQAGIYYYFKHEDGGEVTMVMSDKTSGYYDLPEKTVEFPPSHSQDTATDHVRTWQRDYQFVTGKYAQTDYNFKDPNTSLMTNADTRLKQSDLKDFEVYDFPGEYVEKGVGEREVKVRLEEEELRFDQVKASSTCRTFSPGGKFAFGKYKPSDSESGSFLITAIHHRAQDPSQHTGRETAEYSNSFSCIPADVVFRPARITPKPVISGLQSAVVVGQQGEEIDCDEYGRVLVRFHWARDKHDDQDSRRVRVALGVAGKKWGFQAIPRIGQEVMVDFLEGDPDQPVIVGGVYNEVQAPHYALPEHAAKTYIKTNSTKGGEGFNELMFDDRADQERVFVHGQKDMDVRVRNDSRERIGANRHQIIGNADESSGDQKELVHGNKHQNVKQSQVEQIEGDYTLTVGHGEASGGNMAVNVENNLATVVGSGGIDVETQGGTRTKVSGSTSLSVQGDLKEKVGGSASMNCSGSIKEKTSMSYSMDAGMDVQVQAGMNTAIDSGMACHIKSGMTLVLEAGVSVCLKAGGNFITIGPAGIFIQGTLVSINSGGAQLSGSGCSPEAPDSPDEVQSGSQAGARPEEPDEAHTENTGYKSAAD